MHFLHCRVARAFRILPINLLIDPYRRKKLGVGLMASLKLFRPEQALELIYLITTGYADLVNAEYFIIGKSRA